jgi:hypothetical protein
MHISRYSNTQLGRPLQGGTHRLDTATDEPTFSPADRVTLSGMSNEDVAEAKVLLGVGLLGMTAGIVVGAHFGGFSGALVGALCGVSAVSMYGQRND